jgi:hypothetical protein
MNVSVLPDEPDTSVPGVAVSVPAPSADRRATCGEVARLVSVPEAVEDSSVVNVDVPAEDGAVAPAPPRLVSPYTILQAPPDASDTLVTSTIPPLIATLPQVEDV